MGRRREDLEATEEGAVATMAAVALSPSVAPIGRPAPIPDRMTWERALAAWHVKLQSTGTRATYASAVRAFFATLSVPAHVADLDMELLDAYAGALRRRADRETPQADRLAAGTVNTKLAALRSFLHFCRRRGWLVRPVRLPEGRVESVPTLTAEQIAEALEGLRAKVQRPYQIVEGGDELQALLAAAARDTFQSARSVALVGLGLGAGLRVAELVALDVGDLASDATGCYVDVREGKGRKDRQVPIAEDVYAVCLEYLRLTGRAVHRSADRETPLFLSRKRRAGSGRLTTRQAQRIVAAAVDRAGLEARGKHVTPHGLRHSYAIDVLLGNPEQGRPPAPLPAVSKLLGHSSVAVTGRYVNHFDRRDLAAYAPRLKRTPPSVASAASAASGGLAGEGATGDGIGGRMAGRMAGSRAASRVR